MIEHHSIKPKHYVAMLSVFVYIIFCCLYSPAFASDNPFVFRGNVTFGMKKSQVISLEGTPDLDYSTSISYDVKIDRLSAELSYSFSNIGELYVILYEFTDSHAVKPLGTPNEGANLDTAFMFGEKYKPGDLMRDVARPNEKVYEWGEGERDIQREKYINNNKINVTYAFNEVDELFMIKYGIDCDGSEKKEKMFYFLHNTLFNNYRYPRKASITIDDTSYNVSTNALPDTFEEIQEYSASWKRGDIEVRFIYYDNGYDLYYFDNSRSTPALTRLFNFEPMFTLPKPDFTQSKSEAEKNRLSDFKVIDELLATKYGSQIDNSMLNDVLSSVFTESDFSNGTYTLSHDETLPELSVWVFQDVIIIHEANINSHILCYIDKERRISSVSGIDAL